MEAKTKRIGIVGVTSLLVVGIVGALLYLNAQKKPVKKELPPPAPVVEAKPLLSEQSTACLACHESTTPGLVAEWKKSGHAEKLVGCFECHKAADGDIDAFVHNGFKIATIVTPTDCATCHTDIVKEFEESHHAKAASFIGSLDNVLGEVVEGLPAAINGCQQCHGSTVAFLTNEDGSVKKDESGKPLLNPSTWPNTGIGRVNLDGSLGSCTACHSRHAFSKRVARFPDTCGKCHMGPDHPQIEIYNESKHGIAFRAKEDEMNLDSDTWVAGVDYTAAPTCTTCHMSATRTQPITHDPGKRISWTLRPMISTKLENWEEKRKAMQDVCSACHAADFVDSFYKQYDSAVDLYNEKFAIPSQKIMLALKEGGKVSIDPFDDPIEFTFYELWHHEGRRARMGASMQGPDYTQWHGFYEVAKHFYAKFIPEARALAAGDPKITAVIDEVMNSEAHRWKKGMTPEEREKIKDFYLKRYGQ